MAKAERAALTFLIFFLPVFSQTQARDLNADYRFPLSIGVEFDKHFTTSETLADDSAFDLAAALDPETAKLFDYLASGSAEARAAALPTEQALFLEE